MKAYRIYAMTFFVLASLITLIIGCKYDVAEPLWYSPPANSTDVKITGVNPAHATPGVNYITIQGTNLSGALDSNRVTKHYSYTDSLNVARDTVLYDSTFVYNGIYFDNVQATVVQSSSTTIKVLRPNVVSDNCIIRIASDKSRSVAKFGPYKIDAVEEQYGSFVANVALGTITIDSAKNLYVAETVSKYLWKIAPDGQKTQVMTRAGGDTALVLTNAPNEAKISPDGKLYYLQSSTLKAKELHMVDLNAPTVKDSLWYTFSPSRTVCVGDFDANGYLYTGGRAKSGIIVFRPNRSIREDVYYTAATDTIFSIRVFNGYVYIATRSGIYRHSISDTSKLGAQELVLDLTKGVTSYLSIKSFSFSSDGSQMFIGSDSKYTILRVAVTSIPIPPSQVEVLYKGILPTNCKQFCFDTYIYAIIGNASPAVNWTIYKIDVGTTGAPYY